MSTARAMQVSHPGGPFELVERAIPRPGPRQVRGGLALDGRAIVLGADQKPMQLVIASLIGRRTGIRGGPSGSSIDSEDTMRFSAMTGVRPMTEAFPLEKPNEAYERMMSNQARFRVVITTGY
jgi:D-arabinose 1-dehydrogenase-like Zn-dependent alcohol dehydrogenase